MYWHVTHLLIQCHTTGVTKTVPHNLCNKDSAISYDDEYKSSYAFVGEEINLKSMSFTKTAKSLISVGYCPRLIQSTFTIYMALV